MKTNLDIVYILDREFNTTGVIDEYYSLIWTTRFRGAGEVQLELPATRENVAQLPIGAYLQLPSDPDTLMVLETMQVSQSFEEGAILKMTGHSLESLVNRRVAQRINAALKTNPALIVKGLMNDNAVEASNEKRNFPKMVLGEMDEDVPEDKFITYGIDGQNVYDLIDELCDYADLGWRIKPDYETKGFIFELYRGEKRTYDQTDNPWVVFSSSYDNLISSQLIASDLTKYNALMYKGPEAYYDDGKKLRDQIRDSVWTGDTEPSGLDRREVFMESNQSWNDPDSATGALYSQATMAEFLKDDAKVALEEASEKDAFEGELDTLRQFVYGVDFQIGDICQMSTEYGVDAQVRIDEVVQSMDGEGYKLTPTFVIMNWENQNQETEKGDETDG